MEKHLLIRIAKHRNTPLNYFFLVFILSGTAVAWFLAAGILWITGAQAALLHAMLAGFLSFALGVIVKKLVKRPRPVESIPGFEVLYNKSRMDSFPSNHAGAAFALFTVLAKQGHPYAPFVGIWFFFVALSRLYSGAHYPTDILGGMVLAQIPAWIIMDLFHR